MNRRIQSRAFSLVELLLVCALIISLMAIFMPSAAQIGSNVSVASAGNQLKNQILYARQTAISLNRPVEVRCYEVPEKQGSEVAFRAFRLWVYDESGIQATPLGKLQYFPQNLILDAQPVDGKVSATACASTLIDSAPTQGTEKLNNAGTQSYPYRAFRYGGNGSSNLNRKGPGGANSNTWYYTLRASRDGSSAGTGLPKNYFTIQIDPLTGQIRTFRP